MAAEPITLEPRLPAGLPEDWRFQSDLPCPTCRYNLRMLRTPRCPECGGVFRWQALLNIGCPRCGAALGHEYGGECPECSLPLDWAKLLDAADPGANEHLYEYSQKPLRRMLQTWRQAARPKRFWQSIPIELAPNVPRLKLYVAVAICIGAATLLLPIAWGLYAGYSANMGWGRVRMRLFYGNLDGWRAMCALGGLLPLVTAFALPFFVPTLSQFRIRGDQLLRFGAYACTPLAWLALIMTAGFGVIMLANWLVYWSLPRGATVATPWSWDVYSLDMLLDGLASGNWPPWSPLLLPFYMNIVIALLLAAVGIAWWWRFLYVGLRDYLRLDARNTWALILSTQAIGLLSLGIVWTSWMRFLRVIGAWIAYFAL